MTYTVNGDVRTSILGKLASATLPGLTIAWPNKPFKPVPGSPFVRVFIMVDMGEKETMIGKVSHRGNRYSGLVILQLHSVKGVGDAIIATQRDLLSPVFSDIDLPCGTNRITFKPTVPGLEFEDGEWVVTNIETEFSFLNL